MSTQPNQASALGADAKFIEIVTSGDVETKVAKVNAYVTNVNSDISASNVDDRFKRAWAAFHNAWRAFYEEYKDGCWFGCVAAIERAEQFEREAVEWSQAFQRFGGTVTTPAPDLPPPRGWWMKPALWVAGILGVAYIVGKLVPGWRGYLTRRPAPTAELPDMRRAR